MRRLRILIWHIHGSYLDAITSVEHDWYLPVWPGRYGGRRLSSPPWVHDVPHTQVRDLDLDLIILQSPRNLEERFEILSPVQVRLPIIYLEHNVPRPHAVETRHPVDDPRILLVHVTQYNRLMWDNGRTPTMVVEHSVAIDRSVRYHGDLPRGLTAINGMEARARIVGLDIFLRAREHVPLDVCGIETERFGGLGDVKYRDLPALMASYRFLFSPVRYTSLPLAVVEAMTIGLPVVALATTELPAVIRDGWNGYLSCDEEVLTARMQDLIDHPAEARRLGENARRTGQERFGMERFRRDWNDAFQRAIELNMSMA